MKELLEALYLIFFLISALLWIGSATIRLTPTPKAPGEDELDKVAELLADLRAMGALNGAAAFFTGFGFITQIVATHMVK